jgi:2-polyprenyl-3-methyl-5-hydroxy-6-metoxy-1,4-benzoquinol methylase
MINYVNYLSSELYAGDVTLCRTVARQLAQEFISQGKPLDWFEALYRRADGASSAIPWADMAPNPNLVEWLDQTGLRGDGMTALVIGCGLGDDAEALFLQGFRVTAFDISQTAIKWCRRRFPDSNVVYCVEDLLTAPTSWTRAFDFVFEAYTLQVLTEDLRKSAAHGIADFVAHDGTLLVITRGRDPHEDRGQMPWPLVREELRPLETRNLSQIAFEDYFDDEEPPVRRYRVEYRKK